MPRKSKPRPRTGSQPRSLRLPLPLIIILALSLALRIWGIDDRLPDPTLGIDPIRDTVIDETDRREMAYTWEMWRGGLRPLDLNPHSAEWPGLSFYFTLLLQVLYRALYSLGIGTWGASAFAHHVRTDPGALFLFCRLGSALVGVASVYLTYRLGRRVLGEATGLLASGLVAVNAFHITASQHVSDPNLLALVFVLLASVGLADVRAQGSMRSVVFSGAMIGLATASKYTPVVLLLALGAALIARGRQSQGSILWRDLGIATLACIGAVALASPFSLIDWRTTIQDVLIQRERHLSEWVGQTRSPMALPTYLSSTLPAMLGWPALILGLAGMMVLMRQSPVTRIVALVPVLVILSNGLLRIAQPRFVLPALPTLLVGVAAALMAAVGAFRPRLKSRRARHGLTAVLIVFLIASPVYDLIRTRRELGLPDTRHLVLKEVSKLLATQGQTMAMDVYGPPMSGDLAAKGVVLWPFFAEQAELVEVAYHPEWLDGLGYYVLSEGVASRYRYDPDKHAFQNAFYEWLRTNGPLVWAPDRSSSTGPWIEVRQLPGVISTRSVRDSLWSESRVDPRARDQLALWCRGLSEVFLRAGLADRAEEWATRGLSIPRSGSRLTLYRLLSESYMQRTLAENLVRTARAGLREFPRDYVLHVRIAMGLDALGRSGEAAEHYRASLTAKPDQPGADGIGNRIRLLESRATLRR